MPSDIQQAKGYDTVLDVTEEQLGRVYATAFLGACESGGEADEAVSQLEAVVTEVLDAHPKFAEAVRSAFLSHEERVGLIDRVLGGKVLPVVLNTLKVLSQHNRSPLLRTMVTQARKMLDERAGRVPVQVTSAVELTPSLVDTVRSTLGTKLGVEPALRLSTDADLIGGFTVRVGDTVYDASLKTVFEKAKHAIIEDTISKIEQNPELFLSPESESA